MAKKAIIRLGDKTSHDGVVLEAFENLNVYGKPAAGIGHRGHCPKCKKDFVIVAGAETVSYFGKAVALEGMKTSCGAVLIASQQQATVDVESGANTATSSASGTNSASGITATSAGAKTQFDEQFTLVSDVTGEPLANTAYRLTSSCGKVVTGTTDAAGKTTRITTAKAETISVEIQHA